MRFLVDQGIEDDSARFLVEMENNPNVLNTLAYLYPARKDMQKIPEAITHLPVLKELTRESREKFLKTIEGAKQNNREAIINPAQIIREAEYRCILTSPRSLLD